MRYSLIDPQGNVENIIEYDGKAEYAVPDGYTLRKAKTKDEIVSEVAPPTADERVQAIQDAILSADSLGDLQAKLAAQLEPS